jgi:hypothetical protein
MNEPFEKSCALPQRRDFTAAPSEVVRFRNTARHFARTFVLSATTQ